MNTYNIKYYTSGGYKASAKLETECIIENDCNNDLILIKNGKIIGGIEEIETIFLKQLGYVESITIYKATLENK